MQALHTHAFASQQTRRSSSGIAERKETPAMGASPSHPSSTYAVTSKLTNEGENHRIKYASSTMQGLRPDMQDALAVELDLDATTSFFGVYDGHGGQGNLSRVVTLPL
uniref:protein-serine/threonine phosphatase n=1 Tax=Leersia perrieri TaxID=77586 RepID=A0A0D9VHW7_9ORYZ